MELEVHRATGRLIGIVLASMSVGLWLPGLAEPPTPGGASDVVSDNPGSKLALPAKAATLTQEAVGDLRQAALQRYVADPGHERDLLTQARGRLERAASVLSGAQRDQVLRLLADLDAAMRRRSAQLGRVDSPVQEPLDPPIPGRNELAVLAKQGQALLDDQPLVRPPNTDEIAWRRLREGPIKAATGGSWQSPAWRQGLRSVPGETVAWPQLNLPLGR